MTLPFRSKVDKAIWTYPQCIRKSAQNSLFRLALWKPMQLRIPFRALRHFKLGAIPWYILKLGPHFSVEYGGEHC
jgi:hypothetical protein